jgi:hypothetical protein
MSPKSCDDAANGFLIDGDPFLKPARRDSLPARVHSLMGRGTEPLILNVVSVWRSLMQERAGIN